MGKHVSVTLGTIEPLAFLDDINPGKTALICEGGGQRGIFTAGVLDEFLICDFNPFDLMIGTSAGAQNLSAYICGQVGYARRVITRYTTNSAFFNPLRFIRGGHLIDLDWLVETTANECPLRMQAGLDLLKSGREFYMGASRSDDFTAEFLQPTDANSWLDMIRASSAIPGFYRTGVEFDGTLYHDGGISAAVPVEEAYRRGADTIVVIRTVPSQMYFTPEWLKRMTQWLEGDSNSLQRMATMLKVHLNSYRKTQEFIENPPNDVQIFEIYPPVPLKSSALGSKISSLNEDYHTGRRCGRYFIAALGEAFNQNLPTFSRTLEQKIEDSPIDIDMVSQEQEDLVPAVMADTVIGGLQVNDNRDG
ncbi:patatin-like phospholipase family protein [Providencia sp. Me31A]|uniref:patatin-like phospholipase family protein n=1 Tax=Providencia sp. Me31A TaxID=3392637 RepID=UPI003D29F0C6